MWVEPAQPKLGKKTVEWSWGNFGPFKRQLEPALPDFFSKKWLGRLNSKHCENWRVNLVQNSTNIP